LREAHLLTFRNIGAGLSCLFEAIVIAGYFGVAWLVHSWIMLLAPFALAGAIAVWAVVRSRFDDD
jgi:hypothetical protein